MRSLLPRSLLERTSCKICCDYQLKDVVFLALELHSRFSIYVEDVERLELVNEYYSILSMHSYLLINASLLLERYFSA